MADSAPEEGRPTAEFMGLPSEKHGGAELCNQRAADPNPNGDALVLHNGEPQTLEADSSEINRSLESTESNRTTSSVGKSQQVILEVNSSQHPSNDDQAALPIENQKRKRGRPRKTEGCVRKNSRNHSASDVKPTRVARSKTQEKTMLKFVSEHFQQNPPPSDISAIPETPEMTPGGRPKRKAAKAALEYLHSITKDLELSEKPSGKKERDGPVLLTRPAQRKALGSERGLKRKTQDFYRDQFDDADFDPEGHEDEESEEDEGDEEYEDPMLDFVNKKTSYKHKLSGCNGLSSSTMQPLWESFRSTIKFRQEHCSSWIFPEWIPSVSDWHLLSTSEVEKYLPEEEHSAAFKLSREGIKEQHSLHRMKRFGSLPPHMERWDSLFFVGGPVWAMEWCPCPEGAAETQYVALSCNRGMDDRHKINMLYNEHALLQLWDLGRLQVSRPSSSPSLAYALALDDGCIWDLKWCPAGAWELPSTSRKEPHLPRLGLIAVAFSNGTIAVFSLPHPEALKAQTPIIAGEAAQGSLIYQVGRILTVKLGSSQMDHNGQSGQCFALDWLPVKPHNILVAGFYDGTVALWDLSTKSSLQKVRSPEKSLLLYPYHSFLAHDHTVRSLRWCGASSELLVTVGDDRMVKLWNVTNTCNPLKSIKRFLPTEVSWPTFWSGIFITQECCFSALGQQGLHYLDSGYFGHKPFFVCTRKSTVWSFSMSDWMNSCVLGDNMGDCVCSLLCDPDCNYSNTRRHRFPVYRTEMAQFRPGQRLDQSEEEEMEEVGITPQREPQNYRAATKTYYLHFHDMDLRSFTKYQDKPLMKQLHTSETKGLVFADQMPLNALYKVRFSPNMDAHCWVLSAGQSGLVRAHCVRGLSGPSMHKLVCETQEQFTAMFRTQETIADATAIRHFTADTVQVR
ncbi:general transcription factor 3C polypeptide 2-like [Astyanax mexicanus]|uniref:General transcription factor 3C polypeptide 2 n=1 Tax=Astyanax mexicanus TaxID=7994 RepID=A0A8B9H8X3_ASTMX|nr:general transcription factor 3C polypeptide 2-like [Astyanax mexicanus]